MPKAKSGKKGSRLHDSSFTEQLERSADDIRPKKKRARGSADKNGGSDDEGDVEIGSDVDESDLKMVSEAKRELEERTVSSAPGMIHEGDGDGGEGESDDYEIEVDVPGRIRYEYPHHGIVARWHANFERL